jgi:hypothetical protein
MPISKDYEFACQACGEPFQFFLPEQVTRASIDKCLLDDVKRHNLPLTSQCHKCGKLNTAYYCISGHQ